MSLFLFLVLINTLFLIYIIKNRGILSCEGLGMLFVLLGVASNGIGIIIGYYIDSEYSIFYLDKMQYQLVPLVINLVGLIMFFVGLKITDPQSSNVGSVNNTTNAREILHSGWTLFIVGLIMKILAMYLNGITSLGAYLDQLYDYDISVRKYGFLDQGVTIALFGIILIILFWEKNYKKQLLYIVMALSVTVLLSTSKSGIVQFIVPFLFVMNIYSKQTLKRWGNKYVLSVLIIIFIVSLGIKTQIKYSGLTSVDYSYDTILDIASTTVMRRFSDSGLFESYSNLVNRIRDDPSLQFNGDVLINMFVSNIPRFVWNDFYGIEKPDHPFHAIGELINTDYLVDYNSNDAVTFVGFAFADFGYISLVIYMLVGGMILGYIRKTTKNCNNQYVTFGYLFFSAQFSTSIAETGFLSLNYYLLFSIAVVILMRAAQHINTKFHTIRLAD